MNDQTVNHEFLTTLPRLVRLAALACACALVPSCATTTHASLGSGEKSVWLEPSPQLRQQIESEAKRLPWTHGLERVELIRWFGKVGEPAYPVLLEMVCDSREDVAGAALAALGSTRDSRLVEPLRSLPWPKGAEDRDLALERARTLVRLGDWEMMPVLIEGLSDDRLVTRALCAQALFEATHERFDFDPRAEPEAREASIARWQGWWSARDRDPMLAPAEKR
jgi:hypothetical protein